MRGSYYRSPLLLRLSLFRNHLPCQPNHLPGKPLIIDDALVAGRPLTTLRLRGRWGDRAWWKRGGAVAACVERPPICMVGPARPQFVLFGSSIVQLSYANGGWGAILSDIYSRKADIVLRGYYGWNSCRAVQVLDKVFPKDAVEQPSLVIVYFGGNDSMGPHKSGLGPHVPLKEYVAHMRKIGEHIKSLSESMRIIFLTCPPVNEDRVRQNTSGVLSEIIRTNELCRLYAEACMDLCSEIGVKVINLFTAIQKRPNWMNTCFTDGVHLSAEGSKVVVEEILKVLKEAEWEPSLHWKSMPTEFSEDSPYDLVAADGMTTLNPSEWTFHRQIQWD